MQAKDESIVIDEVLKMIKEKRIKPGEKLPSENKLADVFKLPRMTVRNAFQHLENRGYVLAVKGKGRFLKEEAMPIQLHLSGSESFTDKMIAAGYRLRTEVYEYGEVLNERFSVPVYNISRLRFIDDEPIAIHQSFVNMEMFPMIKGDGPTLSSMFAYYRSCGYSQFTSGKSFLSIQFPSADEQSRLACASVVPLIKLESNTMDKESRSVLEYTQILYRGDKFKYELDQ